MSADLEIETLQLLRALKRASKEALDIIEHTPESAPGGDLASIGYNTVRAVANDAHNICNSLIVRLGEAPVLPAKPEPAPEPPVETPAEPQNGYADIPDETGSIDPDTWGDSDELTGGDDQKDDQGPDVGEGINFFPLFEQSPPTEILDVFDPSLNPRQNQETLLAKYAAAKNAEEHARAGGDMSKAMEHLQQAERFESGIKWNRAVHAEVLG
ncbi:MAG: hypothetical protein AAFW60_01645 [Pseudomonadota bacterium]